MKTKNSKKIRIAYLKEFKIEDIIKRDIELVTEPTKELLNWDEIPTVGTDFTPRYKIIKEAKAAPRKAVLYPKYVFLISLILERCMSNRQHSTTLLTIAMREVLGKHYDDMMRTLMDMQIIVRGNDYVVGKHGRTITLINGTMGYMYTQNIKVIEYYEKLHEIINEKNKEEIQEHNNNDEFISSYNESLSRLYLLNKEEALNYINSCTFDNARSKEYYESKIISFDNDDKKIHSIDKNNRIYHYLTNLPKSLKKFFNIKYQCDIHNSHPLLFSLFLIKKYNIDKEILDKLLHIDTDIYNIHYVGKQLCKLLINNELKKKVKSIPIDIFNYIYTTCNGIFWDGFMDIINKMSWVQIDRGEIKVALFREVFYSHRFKSTKGKPFAKVFKRLYPNVWKAIKEIKAADGSETLPNRMMAEESRLFHQILERCYEHGWKVINIHDAIVVLDVEENNFDYHKLIAIMEDVYKANGLYPNISIE